MNVNNNFIPALRYSGLTWFYDTVLNFTLRESTFKTQLVEQAHLEAGQCILDVGCGTATLTLLIKKLHPAVEVVGLDGDAQALAIARSKIAQSGLSIALDEGLSYDLPYADQSFDAVFSSLLFHHLTRENKGRTLQEVYRVLKPNGKLHVADWGKPHDSFMRGLFLFVQLLDGFETTADNVAGLLPSMFGQVGFVGVSEPARFRTVFGSLCLYSAQKSALTNPHTINTRT